MDTFVSEILPGLLLLIFLIVFFVVFIRNYIKAREIRESFVGDNKAWQEWRKKQAEKYSFMDDDQNWDEGGSPGWSSTDEFMMPGGLSNNRH